MVYSVRVIAFFAAFFAAVSAAPLERSGAVTVPITKVVPSGTVKAIGHADRARAAEFVAGRYGKAITATSTSDAASVSATNALDTYTMQVTVGTSGQTFNLLIDTGSSNTWVGAATKYKPSSSSKSTGDKVTVSYGSGEFSGTECLWSCFMPVTYLADDS